jgi:hypothetical protein
MEIILFNKYLVRGYEYGFILSKVRDGKEPIILEASRVSEAKSNKGELITYRDYSNFGKETFPSTFEGVLSSIRNLEIAESEIQSFEELVELLESIKKVELDIQSKFK